MVSAWFHTFLKQTAMGMSVTANACSWHNIGTSSTWILQMPCSPLFPLLRLSADILGLNKIICVFPGNPEPG